MGALFSPELSAVKMMFGFFIAIHSQSDVTRVVEHQHPGGEDCVDLAVLQKVDVRGAREDRLSRSSSSSVRFPILFFFFLLLWSWFVFAHSSHRETILSTTCQCPKANHVSPERELKLTLTHKPSRRL